MAYSIKKIKDFEKAVFNLNQLLVDSTNDAPWTFWPLEEIKKSSMNLDIEFYFVFLHFQNRLTRSNSGQTKTKAVAIVQNLDCSLELLYVYVTPNERQKGLGFTLLQNIIENASTPEKRKPVDFWLEVSSNNVAALATYCKLGFKAQHTRKSYYKDGSDAIVMKKEILNAYT